VLRRVCLTKAYGQGVTARRARYDSRFLTADEIAQHLADDVGAEASPGKRAGDATPLHLPGLGGYGAELLAGQRTSRAELVISADIFQREVDVFPGYPFGLQLLPQS
jgi:hypothetical protein